MSLRPPLDDVLDRRFRAGQSEEISGLRFRIGPGGKKPGDLVVQWRTPAGWRHIKLDALAFLTDFFYENEHWLFPPPCAGGERVRHFLRDAVADGWALTVDRLHEERARAKARPPNP